jgi:dissimilatory sulfite reductase (desulfoviridin) alpha/beta subunit
VTLLEQQVQSLTGDIRSLRDQAAALTATVTATTAATDANTESVARIDKYLAEHPIAVSCRARLSGVPISCRLQ